MNLPINLMSVCTWWWIEWSETCSLVPKKCSCANWSFVV